MVTFTLLPTYKNEVTFQDVGISMGLEYAYQYLIDGVSPSYTDPVGGFVLNNEAEYNAITWTDIRTKPTWAELTGIYFNSWKALYRSQIVRFGTKQDNYFSMDKPALDAKANQTSLDTTNSTASTLATVVAAKADTSAVNSALSTKVNGKSGMYLHEAQATSDSSSTVTIHLTVDGLSTGAALFSGVPKVVATGKDSSGSPIASPQVAELAWSNSNKTVTFKTSRATNMLLLGNSAVATGAGAVVDVIAYGAKA